MSPSMALSRLLAIMGSGETAPTMVTTHKALFERLGSGATGVLLDTPYAFQENAPDISARAVDYFRRSVGRELAVASGAVEDVLARIAAAPLVFAGPGSPSYALRRWAGTPVPDAVAAKVREGGCVTFASAAALTLGVATVPVYEIYKVGEEPRWLDGLDLLGAAGLRVAVIPHYDNAEGGNHDTRFCYLGERRLSMLEPELPDGTFVLGVDEHTALVLDLDDGTAEVTGRGGVTVRNDGRSVVFPAGTTVTIDELRAASEGVAVTGPGPVGDVAASGPVAPEPAPERSPLLADVDRLSGEFDAALAAGDAGRAAAAILELEQTIADWAGDTLQSDEPDRARAVLRSMVVRLGEAAGEGLGDPRTRLAPLVEGLLDVRERARSERRFDDADRVRDTLAAAGVEVRDTPSGTEWGL